MESLNLLFTLILNTVSPLWQESLYKSKESLVNVLVVLFAKYFHKSASYPNKTKKYIVNAVIYLIWKKNVNYLYRYVFLKFFNSNLCKKSHWIQYYNNYLMVMIAWDIAHQCQTQMNQMKYHNNLQTSLVCSLNVLIN